MRIVLISIGQELLSGRTVNTNATLIGNELLKEGYLVSEIRTIPDDASVMEDTLKDVLDADCIITTGGLGPTGDDKTKDVICSLFDIDQEHHSDIEQELNTRFPNLKDNKHQATYPKGAELFYNPVGTAYGFAVQEKLIALPGVPSQMEQILLESVIPFLKKIHPPQYLSRFLYIFDVREGDVDPMLRESESSTLEIGICPSYGHVSVFFLGTDKQELDAAWEKVYEAFKDKVYSTEEKLLSKALHAAYFGSGKTIAVAESCTGGNVAHQITQNAGSSTYFQGGVVTYSNALKESFLGVTKETLASYGAVSEETARAMAEGLRAQTGVDVAVSVTGIAGPDGGSAEKPVGTIFLGCATASETRVKKLQRRGTRGDIIDSSTAHALHLFLEEIDQ